jgi:hypothetical protein
MPDDDIDFGSRAQPATAAIPAVYMFQPAYQVVLESDELNQWQQLLEEKVGLTQEDVAALDEQGLRPNGTYCLCGSTYFSEACDCD